MSKHTPGPLTVAVSDKWPFNIVTTDAAGNVVFSQDLPCHSTGHNSASEAMAGKDMPREWNAAERNARAFADEVLRAAAPELLAVAVCEEALSKLCREGWPIIEQYGWDPSSGEGPTAYVARMRRAAIAKAAGAQP